jgi:hypothetical protein
MTASSVSRMMRAHTDRSCTLGSSLEPRVMRLRRRRGAGDEVKWATEGWSYYRIHDGVQATTAAYPTWQAAKAALIREQCPATVS